MFTSFLSQTAVESLMDLFPYRYFSDHYSTSKNQIAIERLWKFLNWSLYVVLKIHHYKFPVCDPWKPGIKDHNKPLPIGIENLHDLTWVKCERQVKGIKGPRWVQAAKATSCRGKNLHLSFWYPQSLLMFLFKVILHLKTFGVCWSESQFVSFN